MVAHSLGCRQTLEYFLTVQEDVPIHIDAVFYLCPYFQLYHRYKVKIVEPVIRTAFAFKEEAYFPEQDAHDVPEHLTHWIYDFDSKP